MAKQPAKNANLTINSVATEDDLTSIKLSVKQTNAVVTALPDAGPRRLAENYDYDLSIDGFADFAAAQTEATLFAMLGSAGVAVGYDPTGQSAGASDPNYDSTSMLLASFDLTTNIGAGTALSASLEGNSALARAVA